MTLASKSSFSGVKKQILMAKWCFLVDVPGGCPFSSRFQLFVFRGKKYPRSSPGRSQQSRDNVHVHKVLRRNSPRHSGYVFWSLMDLCQTTMVTVVCSDYNKICTKHETDWQFFDTNPPILCFMMLHVGWTESAYVFTYKHFHPIIGDENQLSSLGRFVCFQK